MRAYGLVVGVLLTGGAEAEHAGRANPGGMTEAVEGGHKDGILKKIAGKRLHLNNRGNEGSLRRI